MRTPISGSLPDHVLELDKETLIMLDHLAQNRNAQRYLSVRVLGPRAEQTGTEDDRKGVYGDAVLVGVLKEVVEEREQVLQHRLVARWQKMDQ
jgi:hypothetical protein